MVDLNGPALAAPDGIVGGNFKNPPNENRLAWGVLVTCVAISTLCLFLRGYGRVYLMKKFEAEEILIILAYGCFWGAAYATFAFVETPGYFVHQWDIRLGDLIPTGYYTLIFGVCYSIVLPLLKVAILVEWCRMFVPRGTRTTSVFWWCCFAVGFVQVTSGIAIVVALNLQCIPHKAIWDFTIPRQCFDLYQLQVASASIQLVSDVAIFLLPQHVIWTLRMTWQKRLGVSVIFGLGLIACVSAAFRVATTVTHGHADDAIFALGPLVFWATAEMTCGFFIVCVPCIPKILKDSGVMRKMKRVVGMKTTGAKSSHKAGYHGSTASTRGKLSNTTATNAYYKLDEDGMPMVNLNSFEDSTEHLHDGTLGAGIIRTTRVTVTKDARSANDAGRNDIHISSR